MPNPKKQHSVTRGRKRRTHWKAYLAHLGACPQCKKPIVSHRICPFCGYYKGRLVVDVTAVKAKKGKEEGKG